MEAQQLQPLAATSRKAKRSLCYAGDAKGWASLGRPARGGRERRRLVLCGWGKGQRSTRLWWLTPSQSQGRRREAIAAVARVRRTEG